MSEPIPYEIERSFYKKVNVNYFLSDELADGNMNVTLHTSGVECNMKCKCVNVLQRLFSPSFRKKR